MSLSCLLVFSDVLLSVVPLADVESSRTKMRSAVSVREGQGVVLLCGTPPRAGGKGGPSGLGNIPGNAKQQNYSKIGVLE